MPPGGEDPGGGDDSAGGDSPDDHSNKALLRVIAAIDDKETRTETTIHKFFYTSLLKKDEAPEFLFRVNSWGPYSPELNQHLCEVEEDGLVRSRPSQHPKVDTNIYEITEKGKDLLTETTPEPNFEESYDRFKKRYGQTGSWKEYDELIYSWISEGSNYVGIDLPLMDCLKRKSAVANDFDPLFDDFLQAGRPAFLNDIDKEKAPFAKLAYYLQRKKCESECRYDHRDRFSVRTLSYSEKNLTELEDKMVLLRGYAEKVQHQDRIFYLKEGRVDSLPDIRVEFYGEWNKPSQEILENHSIGVLGYVTKSNDEITIKALAIVKANELPEKLRGEKSSSVVGTSPTTTDDLARQTSLSEFEDQRESALFSTPSEGQTSLSDFRNQRDSIIENIEEAEEQFLDNHHGEVSKEKEEDGAQALEDLSEEVEDDDLVERERLKKALAKASNKLESVDTVIRVDFLIEILRWVSKRWDVAL